MASKKTETGIVDFPVQKATKKPRIAFGSTLREYRLKAHLEQEQVGKACGVTGNAISNWERDVARPDASLVPTLCNLLNIPLYGKHYFYAINCSGRYPVRWRKGFIMPIRSMIGI